MTVTVPTWFPVLSPSDVAIDQSFEGLIHHSRFSNTQRALLQGTPVVALSFTSTTFKTQLWQSTVDIITEQLCQASTHPTFVQTLGVVGTVEADATNTSLYHLSPSYVVMEAMPVSLYDILHVEQLPLTREHIILIATEILRGLQFLHHRNQSFCSTLTSRKVMLGSTRHIKLRRFGLEQIGQKAETPDLVAASYASLSHYIDQNGHGHDESADILDLKAADQAVTKEVRDKQCEDIYAFGVLLLEMTTHEKPNVEIFNRISSTAQVDPVLETVIRLALGVTPSGSRSGVTYPRELLNKCLESLSSIKLQHRVVAVEGGKPPHSVISFPSFVQADDYVQRHESAVVLKSVGDRDRQNEVALKRLAAVEEDLVEEQKNFEIVVRQLEQAKIVLGHRDDELEQETQRTRALHEEIAAHDEMISNLQNDRNTALRTIEELQDTITSYEERLEQSRIARLAIERERQELLVEIMKLKDEKRAVLDQKAEVESQYAAVAAKVGSEKEAIEELEGRYTQAIHRWKHEQAARAQVERRLEAISQQLVAMEDERARFSAALQSTPLGGRDPRESSDYVLDLKEKCIASLQNDIQQMQKAMEELQSDLERSQSENHRLQQVVITDLEQQTEKLMDELRNLEQHFVEEQETTTELTKQLEEITLEHDLLKQKAFALDLEVAEMKKKADDEEQARRQRRCLTPNCDAPKYLVRPSGYCVECIEKMAKGTPSGSTRKTPAVTAAAHLTGQKTFLDAPRNMQTVEILRSIEKAREDLSPEDDDPRNESMTELVCLLKQFSTLLKENGSTLPLFSHIFNH
ncbi:hypothetical protein Poli38472_002212 [Pythium oligandrum]|uniref:Protein kinase domain-containing protein n=1 Tax=Pythium oligandrum TaxID=41045 RepID=A0A8K1FHZ9_PYTOL|nr:hypothetical protein Poli38472_002212 [Pythium oligandrum]|eukprot:TMW63271.1 hypothetical protein Poli38472_002212 [Pythium oligandrum]